MIHTARSTIIYLSMVLLALLLAGCNPESTTDEDEPEAEASTAELLDLTVDGATLDQTFQPNQFSYTATVSFPVTSVYVAAIYTASDINVTINGSEFISGGDAVSIPLELGLNQITVILSSLNSVRATYTIEINRESADEFAQQQFLKSSDADEFDTFGTSVAVDGDTLVVGAKAQKDTAFDATAGAAYVFTRINGVWTEQQKLKPSDSPDAGREFGNSVAIEGDTIVVGAVWDRGDPNAPGEQRVNGGAVYVFTRTNDIWTQQQKLRANDPQTSADFGYSVDISGSTVAIGARVEDDTSSIETGNSGAVYIFTESNDTWSQQAKLKADNVGGEDNFGISVGISGDTVVAGAVQEDGLDDGTQDDAGAAYVFTRTGTTWTQQEYLQASDIQAGDQFGASVAIDGDTIVVGATLDETSTSAVNTGAAYVFTRSNDTWSEQDKLVPTASSTGYYFGESIDIDGDTIVVGTPLDDSNSDGIGTADTNSGAVFVFTNINGSWTLTHKLKAGTLLRNSAFGYDVAVSGDTVVIGAKDDDTGLSGTADIRKSGSVYVWQ